MFSPDRVSLLAFLAPKWQARMAALSSAGLLTRLGEIGWRPPSPCQNRKCLACPFFVGFLNGPRSLSNSLGLLSKPFRKVALQTRRSLAHIRAWSARLWAQFPSLYELAAGEPLFELLWRPPKVDPRKYTPLAPPGREGRDALRTRPLGLASSPLSQSVL